VINVWRNQNTKRGGKKDATSCRLENWTRGPAKKGTTTEGGKAPTELGIPRKREDVSSPSWGGGGIRGELKQELTLNRKGGPK